MAEAGSPFSVVDQFVSLREGLGTSPLAPQNQRPALDLPQIKPKIVPQQGQAQPYQGASAAAPARPAAGSGVHVTPYLQQLAAMFPGLRQTSGYRTPEHNAEVGGVPNSWHTQQDDDGVGRASDWVGSAADMQAAAAWAQAQGAVEVLVHNAGSGQHLHTAW